MDKNLINQLLALPGEELHLKKGDFLFHEGDKAEHFYVVVKGRMSIKKFEASGHIFALRLVGPNQELAEFAATSRESLNRMLSELRKLGYVAYDKHHLVICDFDALIGLLDLEVDNIDPNISNIE